MADVVQYRLERMVPELDDLERRGLFTQREIAEILKTRRKFEYRLNRPSPLKQDFLEYIDYQKQLVRLRLLRKKSVSCELNAKGNKKMKKSVSDFASIGRIIEIYRMATSRFKGDLELWFQYLEFCKERKNGRMKKLKFLPFNLVANYSIVFSYMICFCLLCLKIAERKVFGHLGQCFACSGVRILDCLSSQIELA